MALENQHEWKTEKNMHLRTSSRTVPKSANFVIVVMHVEPALLYWKHNTLIFETLLHALILTNRPIFSSEQDVLKKEGHG